MGRRGNPYDDAKAESFMKTLKVEEIYLMSNETFDDVAASSPRVIDEVYTRSTTESDCARQSDIAILPSPNRSIPGRWAIRSPTLSTRGFQSTGATVFGGIVRHN
jgi:transposase InsO family protein